jgi:hypothetical protein
MKFKDNQNKVIIEIPFNRIFLPEEPMFSELKRQHQIAAKKIRGKK